MDITNTAVHLRAHPSGVPGHEHFEICREILPDLKGGEVLVAVRYVSISPSLRLQMNAGDSYLSPIPLGGLVRARAVGEVLASQTASFVAGDHVEGPMGPQTHYLGSPDCLMKIDTQRAPIERYLSVLGLSGLTAYFGLVEIGLPKAGDIVVVSAAAGSVGSVAGQIAKRLGCRVIGIAGGLDKCTHVTDDLGFDACVDYRSESVRDRLAVLAPDGIDLFFDNVGGDILEAVLDRLALYARIVICGAISTYNDIGQAPGPRNFLKLLEMRARAEGFSIYDYRERYAEAQAILAGWLDEGAIKPFEHVETGGIERFPDVLPILFSGAHKGKLMLQV